MTFTIMIQLRYIRPIRSSTVRSSNSTVCKGPLNWNKVPYDIISKPNINSFASALKACVLSGYDSSN